MNKKPFSRRKALTAFCAWRHVHADLRRLPSCARLPSVIGGLDCQSSAMLDTARHCCCHSAMAVRRQEVVLGRRFLLSNGSAWCARWRNLGRRADRPPQDAACGQCKNASKQLSTNGWRCSNIVIDVMKTSS